MDEWITKMNFRSSMSAQQLYKDGIRPSNIRPIVRALFAFSKLIKGGILQGRNGFKVAITTMFQHILEVCKT